MTTTPGWPADWLRGVLGPSVLSIISEGPTYGYLIAQRLERDGMGEIKGGTLYPLLGRYEQDGLIDASWRAGGSGPGRKYFALTDSGREHLTDVRGRWANFARAAGALIEGERSDDHR